MYFLVDNNHKVIFGWSAKCGCSHIKRFFWFLQNNNVNTPIHTWNDIMPLPDDIENYTTIIICRNPYKRLVSGFLDKYNNTNGEFIHLWKYNTITFSMFVDELIKNEWVMIEKHHFTPQTTEHFTDNIFKSKCLKWYDIANIDYEYIEQLYNQKIPHELLHSKLARRAKYEHDFNEIVYDLYINDYYEYNVEVKKFYNEEIKQKVFKFYENDFTFFSGLGFDYTNFQI